MPTDTEKLSDAELVALVTYVKDDLLLGRANEVTQNRFNRAAVQALEALARRLTARNDTIARVTKVISFVGCDERITVEGLAEAVTKALIPTQPEASEPAATAERASQGEEALWQLIRDWKRIGLINDDMINEAAKVFDNSDTPAAPPDSPERCAAPCECHRVPVKHCPYHGKLQWALDEACRECGYANCQNPLHQPLTAPPETRDAARERAEWLGHRNDAIDALYELTSKNSTRFLDSTDMVRIQKFVGAILAAAAGGKRNE